MPPKKKNGYQMPKPLKTGNTLDDTQKGHWKIGVSIGIGGFGEIYSACKTDPLVKKIEDYPYVVKIEPKENGPLFVEMHFYNRTAKKDEIEAFRTSLKLKTLGMPEFIAMGSHEIESVKHRFIVLPRFGRDIWKIFLENNKKFPLHTVYRIGYQVLNVLEYIHKRDYVHMDIKGTNILLGFGKGGEENVYLVDFGLACHFNTKDFKPDPKKMHNGTIEYTSRDAHDGVPTMRGDLEVLAYNLIEWSGAKLPWVEKKLLAKPVDVQNSKKEFMKNFDKSLKAAYGSAAVPTQITAFFKYLAGMNHDTKPDYSKIRGIFEAGIKELSQKNSGPLDFSESKPAPAAKKKPAPVGKPDFGEPSHNPAAASKRVKVQRKYVESDSDSEDNMVPKKKVAPVKKPSKKPEVEETRAPKRTRDAPKKVLSPLDSDSDSDEEEKLATAKSPQKKPRAQTSPRSTSKENDKEPNVPPPQKKSKNKAETKEENPKQTNKGMITLKSKSSSKGGKKTIQLNFNLDVSLDSDLVVVVNRKDKKKKEEAAAKEASKEEEKDSKWNNAGVYKGKQAKAK